MQSWSTKSALICGAAAIGLMAATPALAQQRNFDIPTQSATKAVPEFARQAGIQIIAAGSGLRGEQTRAIKGDLDVRAALQEMLRGTGLRISSDDGSTITLARGKAATSRSTSRARPISHQALQYSREAAVGGVANDGARGAPGATNALPGQSGGYADQQAPGQDIVVTGSLVAKRGFDMPTPVTVVNEADLQRIGAPDIADVVNQLPSVRASLTNDSTADQYGAVGGTFADLRGMGPLRTLVMVDGRRYSPTNSSGGVSTAALPQVMLGGVDVVTGGASAAYGSDAVAGVVNFKVNDRLKGFRGKVQGGISDYGDYENYLVSLAFGTSLFKDRARLLLAAEIADNQGIEKFGDRPWNIGVAQINNPASTSTNSEPRLLLRAGTVYSNHTLGGLIISAGPLKDLQFAADGSAVPFRYGELVSATQMVGGDGAPIRSMNTGSVPQHRRSAFGRFTFDVSNALSFFVEGNYASLETAFTGVVGNEILTIQRDNPYLPQSVRTVMTAQNITSLQMRRGIDDNARERINVDVDTRRFLAGVNGTFGDGWAWDAYYSGGWTDYTMTKNNTRIAARFNLAIDAVINPANGAIVCRSTLANPTNGCVPMNLIGEGRASAEALRYTNTDAWQNQNIAQHVVAVKVRGEPFSTWAGPVAVAFGGEQRWHELDVTADPLNIAYAYRGGSGVTPYGGKVSVKEAFGEALIPLATGVRFAEHLSLNLAGRITDYSTSGSVYTWKVGGNYSPTDWLRFRATRSRDIRAPNLEELFLGGSTATQNPNDPLLGRTYPIQIKNTGNPLLVPEVANTVTAGVVFSPNFARGLQFSIDYWDIKLNQAINTLSLQTILDQCYLKNSQSACQLITRGPNPGDQIVSVINGPLNFNQMAARGADIELSYRTSLGKGTLDVRSLATYFHRGYIISDVSGVTQLHDSVDQGAPKTIGGNPHWKINTRITYSQGGGFISLAGRYVGGGRLTPSWGPKDIDVLRVSGRLLFDVSGEYPLIKKGGDSVAVFANVRNLFNTDPPITGENGGTSRSLFDVVGRVYNAGIKFRF